MAVLGWGTGGWGTMPWGGLLDDGSSGAADKSYFLPPMFKGYPPPEHPLRASPGVQPSQLWRRAWFWTGNPLTVGTVTYNGGRWNGPLTAAQVDELTNAGYGTRIVTVAHEGQLPPGLDN